MKLLSLVFLALTLYGIFTAHLGAALLAAFMTVFVRAAENHFNRQDAAHAAGPNAAAKPPCTQQLLDQAGVECSSPADRG